MSRRKIVFAIVTIIVVIGLISIFWTHKGIDVLLRKKNDINSVRINKEDITTIVRRQDELSRIINCFDKFVPITPDITKQRENTEIIQICVFFNVDRENILMLKNRHYGYLFSINTLFYRNDSLANVILHFPQLSQD